MSQLFLTLPESNDALVTASENVPEKELTLYGYCPKNPSDPIDKAVLVRTIRRCLREDSSS